MKRSARGVRVYSYKGEASALNFLSGFNVRCARGHWLLWARIILLGSMAPGIRAAVLRVGPVQAFTRPCQAIAVASEGDTIEIDAAGEYDGDVCGWKTNRLTLVGVNGRPKINAAGRSAAGKAIWVISGSDTTVENIELTGTSVESHNGAGIRQEGPNLTVRHCYIHDNEEGILAGDEPSSTITIETTEFANNGYPDGQSHNIYINHIQSFVLRYSYSHDAVSGHLVKSRARENFILYNRLTGEAGTSSFELDLPNGGRSFVIGNVIEQGPLSENGTIIAYGEEGLTNPETTLFLVNNTVVNNRAGSGPLISIGTGALPAVLRNNIFNGSGMLIDQPGARQSHNLFASGLFVNPGEYDYHLKRESPARDFGADPGTRGGLSLVPNYQYVHPACFEKRKTAGAAIDAGAFELGGGGGPDPSCSGAPQKARPAQPPSRR